MGENCQLEMDKAIAQATQAEKKMKTMDKTVEEWKQRAEDMQKELDFTQIECRSFLQDAFKLRHEINEHKDKTHDLEKQNKQFANEILYLKDQKREEGKGIQEVEKNCKKITKEKANLNHMLEQAHNEIETARANVLRTELEAQALKAEVYTRVAEKEEDFNSTRKNHQRALESAQASIDAEIKAKEDGVRLLKNMEKDIAMMEMSIDGINRQRAEGDKLLKKVIVTYKEYDSKLEDELRVQAEVQDRAFMCETRNKTIQDEINGMKEQILDMIKQKKAVETDVKDVNEDLNKVQGDVSGSQTSRRQLEMEHANLESELDDQKSFKKNFIASKNMAEAEIERHKDELKKEKEKQADIQLKKKQVEEQVADLQDKLEKLEKQAARGDRNATVKIDDTIDEKKDELVKEEKRHQETKKELRKMDKKIKDTVIQGEETKRQYNQKKDLIEKLQKDLKTTLSHYHEVEEFASINLAKLRKATNSYESAKDRYTNAEKHLAKMKERQNLRDETMMRLART